MFGNIGKKFIICYLLKQPKCKSEQMSLSLLRKWFVAVAILSFFSINCWCFLRGWIPVFGAMLQVPSTPWKVTLGWVSCMLWWPTGQKTYEPFKPQYPQANSPNWSLYISLKNKLREFEKRSKQFLLGDHLINSHNLISWHCMDIVRGKLMLVTIGT